MPEPESFEQIAVCICTYQRPLELARLLKVLVQTARPPGTRFVIVDNDGGDSQTRDVVHDFQDACLSPVTYIVETEPGLSAARNAALTAARGAGARIVALLDDDEWPSEHWLTKLLEVRRLTGAAVVGGPVRPVFEAGKAAPAKYQSLWSVQEGRLRGAMHVYCTCNCLIDLAAVSFLGDEPFARAFGLSGGEDVVFFRQLHSAGTKMAWSEEAIVFEDVPAARATLAWLRRRWYRLGNVGVRCERAAPLDGTLAPLPKTVLLALRLIVYPLANRRALRMPWLWLLEAERIRGRLASHAGFVVLQYGRGTTPQRQCAY